MREYAVNVDLNNIETKDFDVIIVGSGAAGLYAALNLDEGLNCAIINKSGSDVSNSFYAQGGIASVFSENDTYQSHIKDTLIAGAGLCDEEAVTVLVQEGPKEINKLIEYGVSFDRDKNNQIMLSMEGAHSLKRILHCNGDATGFHLTQTLLETVKKRSNIELIDNMALMDVLTNENNEVTGIITQDETNKYLLMRTSNVILATGGIGKLYRKSTNSSIATGDGIAAAIRAGAKVKNMEFVQFHPTALIHPDLNDRYFLISEALRGEGAILRNRKWEPFMQDVHPLADLAPRDIVSRAIISEMEKHDVPNVYLDITFMPRNALIKRFPTIYNECMKRGIDIAANWIPVVPVQHYFMGGIETDTHGRTNITGLYACGETSCTGVHGANRLASNSLLECLVFGNRCAEDINGRRSAKAEEPKYLCENTKTYLEADFETICSNIRGSMTKKCGIIRNRQGLNEALVEITGYYQMLKNMQLDNIFQVTTLNMANVSKHILTAALNRKESIGAHYLSDEDTKKGD